MEPRLIFFFIDNDAYSTWNRLRASEWKSFPVNLHNAIFLVVLINFSFRLMMSRTRMCRRNAFTPSADSKFLRWISTYRVSIESPRGFSLLVCCRKKLFAHTRKSQIFNVYSLEHWSSSEPSWVPKWRFLSISSLAYFEVDRDSQTSPKSSLELRRENEIQKLVRLEKRKKFLLWRKHPR